MKKSQTALAAPSLLTLHVNADAGLSAGVLRVWRANDKSFDIQDAQNPGHLDLSANYKFAEGWTADPRVGFTRSPKRGHGRHRSCNATEDKLGATPNRLCDAGPTLFACAPAMKQGL